VVDVTNSRSLQNDAVLDFFVTAGRNILSAEAAAGVAHHIALSVVGTDRLLASGYFRAKMAQEKLIETSPVPFTILRSTQFFEFVRSIADAATDGATVRLPPVLVQPVALDDVAHALADLAVADPVNGMVELAGPEAMRLDDLVRRLLAASGDARTVTTDIDALYSGAQLDERSLMPGPGSRIATTRFEDWLGGAP
jgi:uncharacterized protein YbjT (DUF2867 family)